VREQAAVQKDQNKVWSAVRSGTTAQARPESAEVVAGMPAAPPPPRAVLSVPEISESVAVDAPTESYQKIYESRRVRDTSNDFVEEIRQRFARETSGLKGEQVVGVIVAYGGEVAWSDIFASSELFHEYWPKLLSSYVVEALARPGYRKAAARNDAEEFLRRPSGRIQEETEPGVYRWRQINEGQLSLIELEALEPKLMTLHRLMIHRTS
jgi:hypothetical protein